MKAPDKLYIEIDNKAHVYFGLQPESAIECIRKDALMEWLGKTAAEYKKRSDEGELVWQNWCAYNDVINHLNSM